MKLQRQEGLRLLVDIQTIIPIPAVHLTRERTQLARLQLAAGGKIGSKTRTPADIIIDIAATGEQTGGFTMGNFNIHTGTPPLFIVPSDKYIIPYIHKYI